jgi:bifunctional DNA-binding transcriptional regulator/antitoxin component of YhaV-PrlF toxin-antitoxin module
MVTFTSTVENFGFQIWGYHIPVNEKITKQFSEGNFRRVVCIINDIETLHSALMPLDKGSYILINKKVRTKIGLKEGDSVEIVLKKDTSEYGRPVPESFLVLLDQDEVGSKYFHELTTGKQRSLIYIVAKVKNLNSQLNKGLAILDHLTETKGQIDFKRLNEKIKEYNHRGKIK